MRLVCYAIASGLTASALQMSTTWQWLPIGIAFVFMYAAPDRNPEE